MLKRLIEVALPLKEVSEQSAREKSIRHGHISTLHIWWARRPLAACRAVVFGSLIPDPDDPECPASFRKLVGDLLGRDQWKPTGLDGQSVEDTPRSRCLEFIKHLVKWENSNNPEFIDPARKLIAAAHKFLHPGAEGDAPKVLDPFAGGGAIPLEALRLGCEAHAIDLNPVAHLIELCTLVYPQKFGQPDSRPVPDHIKRLIAHNRAKKNAKGEGDDALFDKGDAHAPPMRSEGEIIPDVEITEAEYRRNPLAADVKYWGSWVLEVTRQDTANYYPSSKDGGIPMAYIWARTIVCPNPSCGITVPLFRQTWLAQRPQRRTALRMVPNPKLGRCDFTIERGKDVDFDPEAGTVIQGKAHCPACGAVADKTYIKQQSKTGKMGQQLLTVAFKARNSAGKMSYRSPQEEELTAYDTASKDLHELLRLHPEAAPTEAISPQQPRVMFVTLYGFTQWRSLFNDRQLVTLLSFCHHIQQTAIALKEELQDDGYATAVATYLGLTLDRVADYCSTLSRWDNSQERNVGTFGRQCLPMVWDYAELVPTSHTVGCWQLMLPAVLRVIENCASVAAHPADARQGSATRLPLENDTLMAVVTDPPYYVRLMYHIAA